MTMPRKLVLWVVGAIIACAPASTGLRAASNDAGAGNWQMIVLSGPTQIRGGRARAGHAASSIRRS